MQAAFPCDCAIQMSLSVPSAGQQKALTTVLAPIELIEEELSHRELTQISVLTSLGVWTSTAIVVSFKAGTLRTAFRGSRAVG